MHRPPPVRRAVSLAGALLLALLAGGVALWQGGAFPTLAATGATPPPCLVDRDVPYYGGAAPAIARPPTPPAAPPAPPPPIPHPATPAAPARPSDPYIPHRPPLQNPCQLQLLDERGTP